MTRKKKISLGVAAFVGVGAAIATAILIKKAIDGSETFKNRNKEKEALSYLKDVYGDEALEGKKVVLVNEDEPITRTKIAKDIIAYELQ